VTHGKRITSLSRLLFLQTYNVMVLDTVAVVSSAPVSKR